MVPVLSLGSVLNADDLARWLTSYLKRGVIFEATARVREQSYGSRNTPSIHVRVGPTGWDLLIEPDPDRDYAWHTVMETSDVDVTLTTSDMATLIQTMHTIYEMCTELENLSYATRIPHRQARTADASRS